MLRAPQHNKKKKAKKGIRPSRKSTGTYPWTSSPNFFQNKYGEEESKFVDETLRFEFGDYFPLQMELNQYEKIGGFAIKLVTQF
jgi:hypothetical protein